VISGPEILMAVALIVVVSGLPAILFYFVGERLKRLWRFLRG
jgi:hypothetical protein